MLKKLACVLLVVVLAGTQILSGCAKATGEKPKDPNAIATVTTGDKVTEVTSTDALAKAIDPSGKSVVKLWKDIPLKNAITLPYSCTVDFNGFTISSKAGVSSIIQVSAAGSENQVTTLKNGTLDHYGVGARIMRGGIVVDGMTFRGVSGDCITLADPSFDQMGVSAIRNSTLSSYGSSCINFEQSGGNYRKSDLTIENSSIILYRPTGCPIFAKADSTTEPATIVFGDKVDIYSYADTLAAEGYYYAGNMVPMGSAPESVTVGDDTYEGMNHWSTENQDNAINLLMIGNSFCYYYVQELYGIAHAAGVEINVTNLYEAGCYVQEHWNWLTNEFDGQDKYQYWITNSMGRFKHGQIRTSYEALKYMDWDVITLQQHFGGGIKDYEAAKAKCVPYTKQLFDYLKENHPESTLYWQTTWAYQVGHESMPTAQEQTLKQNNIIKLSQELADESSVGIIPSGQAWAIARSNPQVGDDLCKTDKYHDGDAGGGQYLNACVWFEMLTGKSCIGNTWRPNYLLNESKILELQKAAHEAVAAVYGEDYAK